MGIILTKEQATVRLSLMADVIIGLDGFLEFEEHAEDFARINGLMPAILEAFGNFEFFMKYTRAFIESCAGECVQSGLLTK